MNDASLLEMLLIGFSCIIFAAPIIRTFIVKQDNDIFLKAKVPVNIKEVKFSPDVLRQIDSFDINNIQEKYRSDIKLFIETIKQNFDDESLNILHNNLNTFAVEDFENLDNKSKYKMKHTAAAYWFDENKVIIYHHDNLPVYLPHELLHLCSTIEKDGITYSGFAQVNPEKEVYFGQGLNEGYTQYLCEKYFVKDENNNFHGYFVDNARLIENVVGKDKMQSYYMKADLRSLIDELKRYSTEEEIMQFINNLDLVYLLTSEFDRNLSNINEKLSDVMRNISSFLVHINIEKYKELNIELYNSGQHNLMVKSKEDFIAFINKTIDELPDSFTFYGIYPFDFSVRREDCINEFNNHVEEAWQSIEELKNSRNL